MHLPDRADAPIGPVMPGIRLSPEREEMVPVEGGHIYTRVNGDLKNGRPPIVMAHGGPGSAHWYFLNGTALADERAVILYDQLDSGRSDHPNDPANWRVERFVDELDAIRSHLDIARWHVLGTSWGGAIALEYGARRPEALAGLVLQSPLISTASWLRDANRLKDAMPPAIRDILYRCDTPDAASEADCEAATQAFYRRHIQLRDPAPEIAAYRAALPHSFNAAIYNHMWGRAEFSASGTLKAYERTSLLDRLDGPRTLFLTGEADEATPQTVAEFAGRAGADFAVITDAAHFAMNDNPTGYLAILRPWLLRQDA
jgi:proline iminopeptidase/L-proline amide hydrolase